MTGQGQQCHRRRRRDGACSCSYGFPIALGSVLISLPSRAWPDVPAQDKTRRHRTVGRWGCKCKCRMSKDTGESAGYRERRRNVRSVVSLGGRESSRQRIHTESRRPPFSRETPESRLDLGPVRPGRHIDLQHSSTESSSLYLGPYHVLQWSHIFTQIDHDILILQNLHLPTTGDLAMQIRCSTTL